jgi:hypothetical protein
MVKNILTDIKTYLLATYPQYNTGFANVHKPSNKDVVLDDNFEYRGISDANGNYFYIRSLKETRYSAQRYSCRPLSYRATTNCRIVSVFHNVDEEKHLAILVDAISRLGHLVTRSTTERTQVFRDEVGNEKIPNNLMNLHLCSVDFEVEELVNLKKCPDTINLCNC